MDGSYQRGFGSDLQKFSQNIGSNVQKISQNVKSMQQLVNQLGTDQDSPQLRAQLQQLQQYTNGLAKDTNEVLHMFNSLPVPKEQEGVSWKIQVDRLTREFTQVLKDFQETQRQAASREKEALKRVRAVSDSHYFDDGNNRGALVDLAGGATGVRGGQQLQLQIEQEEELRELQERESHVRRLESDIVDVNQIFKDLATMVHEQGEVIDSIEANVETAQVNVSQGASQLNQARVYQDRSRRKRTVLIIAAILIALIVGLIVWASH